MTPETAIHGFLKHDRWPGAPIPVGGLCWDLDCHCAGGGRSARYATSGNFKENGNLVIQGRRVTDPGPLAKMNIPGHEDVVEVDKAAIEALVSEG